MSLTVFLALSILGIDFLLYVLFQWTYGDKRQAMQRKLATHRSVVKEQAARPFVVVSPKATPETQKQIELVHERMAKSRAEEARPRGSYSERLA